MSGRRASRTRRRTVARGPPPQATRHGLGNRLNNVLGGFALALATGRALVVEWPRTRCHRGRGDCDPSSIDDLFDPPPGAAAASDDARRERHQLLGVKWRRMEGWTKPSAVMCSAGPFIIENNRFSDVAAVYARDLGEKFDDGPKNWCAVCDRSWAHAVSCNPKLRCHAPTRADVKISTRRPRRASSRGREHVTRLPRRASSRDREHVTRRPRRASSRGRE